MKVSWKVLFCYKLMFDFHAIPWKAIKSHHTNNVKFATRSDGIAFIVARALKTKNSDLAI